jgi:cysteine desulfurase / selenocysteine lyase
VSSTAAEEDVWRRVRDDFPFLDRCVYLNTAAAGVSWRGQGQAAAAFYDDAKSLGFNGMSRWREMAARARESIARLTGCAESEIRFVGSTTEGLNLVVSSVAWKHGDEIVMADDEFPSVVAACERAATAGAILRRVSIPTELEREDALAAAITPATRMLAVSHVHWATGTRVDVARLATLCDRVGAIVLVDGVQALGAIPVQLGSSDAYCASVFKWLLSGFGLAVLVVRESLQRQLVPAVRGYNNPSPSTELQYSHVNYPGICALAATLEHIESEVGWLNVFARVDSLTSALSTELEARGVSVITPRRARAGIVSCAVPEPDRVRDSLAARQIYVESREGCLRISPHFYNTHQDIRVCVDALATELSL